MVTGTICGCTIFGSTPDGHDRVALVIGNAQYRSLGTLTNTANDAQDVCNALGRIGFTKRFCYSNVKTRKEFEEILQTFVAALAPNTAAVFFYSGHALELDGQNYLIPTEAVLNSPADVLAETLSVGTVLHRLRIAGNYLDAVILDACRTNSWQGIQRVGSNLAPITDIPRGAVVLYATGVNEAAASGHGRNGILTGQLLRYIDRRDLTVGQMFEKVSSEADRESVKQLNVRQTPAMDSRFNGTFCLPGCQDAVYVSVF